MKIKNVMKILIIVLIAIIVFFCFREYNYHILTKILNSNKDFSNKPNNSDEFYYKITTETVEENSENNEVTVEETAIKNDVVFKRREYTIDGKTSSQIEWSTINNNDNEFCNKYVIDDNNNYIICSFDTRESLIEDKRVSNINSYFYYYDLYNKEESNFFTEITKRIFAPTISNTMYNNENCYMIENKYSTLIFNKETLLLSAKQSKGTNWSYVLTTYEYDNNSLDELVKRPNETNYSKVEFFDLTQYHKENNEEKNNINKPISGTNLKPGETLIENVELLPTENLNFLNLTGNSFGIKTIELHTLESYNKFREKYSNLRELTNEDFDNYWVTIAYNEGDFLSYINKYENRETWVTNYLFTKKESKNKNLVLLITPIPEKNTFNNFIVENSEDIKIDSEKANSILNENCNKILNELNLKSVNIGDLRDRLEKLSNEIFENMIYVNKPINGEEPICWVENYNIYNYGDIGDFEFSSIDIYINAITGEFIGITGKK